MPLNVSPAEKQELLCTYAALVLHDDKVPVTAENIAKLVTAAGGHVEPYWPKLFAGLLTGRNIGDMLMQPGSGPAPAAAAPPRMAGLNLGDVLPNFEADTTQGKMKFHDFLGTSWGVLFSHPADFTPVCTTELAAVAKLDTQFKIRDVKVACISCDPVESHKNWVADVLSYGACDAKDLPFPIIADPKREIATQLGMLDAVSKDAAGLPNTCRAVFVIGPDHKLKLSLLYPATTGRRFDEILRVIDSLQLTAARRLATPGNWVAGQDCVIASSVTTEEAYKLFPLGVRIVDLPSKKGYLRFTPHPPKEEKA